MLLTRTSVREHEFKEKQKDLCSLLEIADTAEATVTATLSQCSSH